MADFLRLFASNGQNRFPEVSRMGLKAGLSFGFFDFWLWREGEFIDFGVDFGGVDWGWDVDFVPVAACGSFLVGDFPISDCVWSWSFGYGHWGECVQAHVV